MSSIAIIGSGYVGLVTGTCLSDFGWHGMFCLTKMCQTKHLLATNFEINHLHPSAS